MNGKAVGESGIEIGSLDLGRLSLCSFAFDRTGARQVGFQLTMVEHDDVILHERLLRPDEVNQLVQAGRGGWQRELDRLGLAHTAWDWGWPSAVVLLLAATTARWVPGVLRRIPVLSAIVSRRAYREVRWTLIVGGITSAILGWALDHQGRLVDESRFKELIVRQITESDGKWEELDLLLVRARDWEAWLKLNHYPADFPGVIGVGFARQVLPEQVGAHEAEMSRRLGFPYSVQPPDSTPRAPTWPLAQNPRLPVVLYKPVGLEGDRWLSNQTILGQDLLFQADTDPRSWSQARRVAAAIAESVSLTSSLEEIAPASWYGSKAQGMRLFVPLTNRSSTNLLETVSPDSWQGVAFASIHVESMAMELYRRIPPQLGFRVFTGDEQGSRFDQVLDTGGLLPESRDRPGKGLRWTQGFPFFHHYLWVEYWTTSLFERQSLRRWSWVVGAAGLMLSSLTSGLILSQVRARERQSAMLEQLQRSHSELQHAHRERARLSRDIHDSTVQTLYALGLQLTHAQNHLPKGAETSAKGMEQGKRLVHEAIGELRAFLKSLRDKDVSGRTFNEFAMTLLERLRQTTTVVFEFSTIPEAEGLSPMQVLHLANITREAVSNALRHGQPTRIQVSVDRLPESGHLMLAIQDNGRGFDPQTTNPGGLGMLTLRERAAELGGMVEVRSTPGDGTVVRVEFDPAQAGEMA